MRLTVSGLNFVFFFQIRLFFFGHVYNVLFVFFSLPQLSDFVPSKTGCIVSAHILFNITLLTLVQATL